MVLKTAPSRVQCVFFAVWRACKAPLVFSGTQKLHPLVFSVFLFCCRPHTRPRVSEKQKKEASPYHTQPCSTFENFKCGIHVQRPTSVPCFECTARSDSVQGRDSSHLSKRRNRLVENAYRHVIKDPVFVKKHFEVSPCFWACHIMKISIGWFLFL